jgi:transcriptional regulator with XRE-family HTH domain
MMKKKEEEFGYYYFLGRVLAERRESLKMIQKTVGDELDINPSDLSRIEHGKKSLAESTLFEICRLYGVQVSEVTSEAHDRYQSYLREREPRQDEPVEQLLPTDPVAVQIVNRYDLYAQSRIGREIELSEKARDILLVLLRYMELKTPL